MIYIHLLAIRQFLVFTLVSRTAMIRSLAARTDSGSPATRTCGSECHNNEM